MNDWRLVFTVDHETSVRLSRWFQRRALVLLDMQRERHSRTARYVELEWKLDEVNHDIVEALAAGDPMWEATDGSTEATA